MSRVVVGESSYVTVLDEDKGVIVTEAPAVVSYAEGFVGPRGPAGPTGPAGDAAEALSFVHTQPQAALLVQIVHNLLFQPAGILAIDNQGDVVEFASVTYPLPGVTELVFGAPFTGTVRLS